MDPLPDEASLAARYEAEHRAGKWQSLFDVAPRTDRVRRVRLLASLAGPASGRRTVLDVGFGDGGFLDEAAAEGWRTFGLEISLGAARSADRRHLRVVGALTCLTEAPVVDVITFWDVLEHVADPADVLCQALARLRPGGLVALSMPNARGTEAWVHGARWRYHDLATYGHLVHAAPGPLAGLLSGLGLRLVHRETSGSVDLRNLIAGWGDGRGKRTAQWMLDKASGALARIAEALGCGNTLLLVARKP